MVKSPVEIRASNPTTSTIRVLCWSNVFVFESCRSPKNIQTKMGRQFCTQNGTTIPHRTLNLAWTHDALQKVSIDVPKRSPRIPDLPNFRSGVVTGGTETCLER